MSLRDYLFHEEPGITLYCGDCRDVLPSLDSAALVLTDPPYGVTFKGRWGEAESIHGDDDLSWLGGVFKEVSRLLGDTGLCVSFYGWPHADVFVQAWRECGFRLLSHFVFVKNVWGLGYYTRGQHEQAYLLGKGESRKPGVAPSDVIEWVRDPHAEHPTEKPVAALLPLVTAYSSPGHMVVDPFCGAGSSLLAAKETGRQAIGIEIEPRYCEIAVKRLRQEVLPFV